LSGELPFSPEEVNTMFAGVINIIAVNTELLKGLVQRLKTWSSTQKLGDLILNMVSPEALAKISHAHTISRTNFHRAGPIFKDVHAVHGQLRASTPNFRRTQERRSFKFLQNDASSPIMQKS
jgi:hypothetical protein